MTRLFALVLGPLGHLGLLPAALQLAFLQAMRDDMGPAHPDLPEVLLEICRLEDRCRA